MKRARRLRLKRLVSDAELRAFTLGFCTAIEQRTAGRLKGQIPLGYLQASRVMALADAEGHLFAGYVIGSQPPLRLLEFVPPEARAGMALPPGLTWDDCVEITCFWRTPDVSPVVMALKVWPRAIRDAVASGRKLMLGHNQSERLNELYVAPRHVTLYAGPSVAGLPSRLVAYETRTLWRQVAGVMLRETAKRLAKSLFLRR